jgi:Ca-activated chloride channel family protein
MTLTFEHPQALLLLLLLPVFFVIGRLGVTYLAWPVRTASIAIRLVLVTLLVLTLAQPVLHRASDQLSVVFAVDRSASVQVNGVSAADQWLAAAVAQAGPNDRVGIIDFGATAGVRRSLGVPQDRLGVPTPDNSQTDLSSALHLATTLFPADGAHRIVVLSDGQTNLGDAVSESRQATTRQVHVDVVPIGPPAGFREVAIDSFAAPASVRLGQSFDLGAVVNSTSEEDATLRFGVDGQQIGQSSVHLKPGANRFSVNVSATAKGFHQYVATISSPNDTYPQNNQAYTFTVVKDTGTVAVVASDPTEAAPLIKALQGAQITVKTLAPAAIPASLSAMNQFDGMVLVDTPATAFSLDQTKTIAGFVHELGRGLIVVGGPTSYGQGKYDGTPLADALPVDSGVPGNVENGNVALVLVIDKSGSMDENEGGVKKMSMADKAAQLAIGLLAPTDDVAVVAFDTDGNLVVPTQKVGESPNLKRIQDLVGQISASGGTDIFAALQMAYQAIHQSNARFKHIILMSDGNSLTDSNYQPLLQKIQDEKITLSTIAIGTDADKNLMQMLAQQGGGTYYYVNDASKIPEITTRETRTVRGSAKVETSFQPQVVSPSPILESFAGRDLPQLAGYVVTSPKHGATIALQSDRKDPILAHWNYGLGRVVAWTADASSRWASNWLTWPEFGRFWSQAVNWSLRPPGQPDLQMSYNTVGSEVDFQVDAVNEQGVFEDLLDLRARIAGADGQPIEVPLAQTRPGHYQARFSIDKPGAYPVDVLQYDASQKVTRTETSGVVVSYPEEYRSFGVNQEKLTAVSAVTGGRVLHDPAEAFDRSGLDFAGEQALPLWIYLLLLAVLLFPIDVAIRRLRVDPLDLAKRGGSAGRRRFRASRHWLGRLPRRATHRVRRKIGLEGAR